MQTSRDPSPTLNMLALLPLPDTLTLSEPQICGRECVWCTAPLSGDTAIDLGERTDDAHGSSARWFPRACHDCRHHVADAAYKSLREHTAECELCVENVADCETGGGLNRVMRRHWR